ncbi:PREDICTED: putative late blight resistance protein homolog R1A-3 isoform X2 [Nicotiana attenuata]|uniref:putative late blight resistance protein homolog R1A-3 isoform X2 n=1 Tax=Nicotiana attenuata TaxID=49451 RepID=UPI00090564F6|nr:PREDICTED: putative late blight resistance protein homolog R1A-3 isoform X2 [Nicotiana attenuata]
MAYASVASLMRTMESVLASNSPMQSLVCDHKEEFLALREKVSFLEVLLKNFEKNNNSGKMIDLEAQIKEAANAVEHTIQLQLTKFLMAKDEMQKEKAHKRLLDSLKQVAEEIDHLQNESPKIQNEGKKASKEALVQDSSSEKHSPNVENNMVGRDDQRKRLLVELTQHGGSSGRLKVVPIVGMGGIGKTTLAKEVYDDASTRFHFDVCAWATISQQHNVKEILLSLLRHTKGDKFNMDDETELADMLQKSLKGKRYLIVLDDMWKNEAWDDVRLCFPSENNGSRILLTTRNIEVACSADTENLSLKMDPMDPVESWKLFKSIAFANEALPSEFETIGKQIVDKCQGLPLTIVVVAGLLSKSERTIEDWENVAEDVKSFVTNDPDKQCLHVLGLSYNHLTSDLKACLLYFGVFPEDSEISVKRLMRLWIAAGFLKLVEDLEGEAEKCLQDLIDRCLVLVSKKNWDETKIRTCKVHDLIYELCLREAQSQNTFVMNDIVYDGPEAQKAHSDDIVFDDQCHHLTRHKMQTFKRWTDGDDIGYGSYRALLTPGHHCLIRQTNDDDDNHPLKRTHSILTFCGYTYTFTLKSELVHFNLLRVLDLTPISFDRSFPPQILSLIWLRYLVLRGSFIMPPEICRLWNLQIFKTVGSYQSTSMVFPEQIWELMQLRHLKLHKFYLSNRLSESVDEERYLNYSNIQTISGLSPSCCTKEVISGIRNVKKLRICGHSCDYKRFQECRLVDNLVHLHQLETLSFKLYDRWSLDNEISPLTIPSAKAFPPTLKKLELRQIELRWEDLDIIGELPKLEVLKLRLNACKGGEWYPIVGRFTSLKLLLIGQNDLKYWKATNDNFPVLERLVIIHCRVLEEIPIEFAEIASLKLIQLRGCNPKLEASAVRIQQEQDNLGNKPVHVHILQSYSGSVDSNGTLDVRRCDCGLIALHLTAWTDANAGRRFYKCPRPKETTTTTH